MIGSFTSVRPVSSLEEGRDRGRVEVGSDTSRQPGPRGWETRHAEREAGDSQIEQGILNLVSNSMQAMAPQGHELEISFIRDGQATREGELLHTLARSRGRPLYRDPLFKNVWGYNSDLAGHLLAVHVRRLRRKIERDPETLASLHTVRGYGYKLDWGD